MRYEDQRKIMVETQLINRGLKSQKVIDAFLKVPRENFVSEDWKEYSYRDHPISIGCKQTISQPYIISLMLSLLDLKESDIVLEIGTGSGYQTALLAEIVSAVYTIERLEELFLKAKCTLKKLEYKNIHFKLGDGCLGWVHALPHISEFDKIVVSAGSPNTPEKILTQLKQGGKMIVPEGDFSRQELIVYEKNGTEIIRHKNVGCAFVPLIGDGAWKKE